MFIASIHVRNFRCVADATLHCEALTALLGPNGCGKSTFLNATDLFFSTDTRVLDEDFYNRDTSSDIEITVEFRDVTPDHAKHLGPYLQESSLKVTRVFSWNQGRISSKFFGYIDRHNGFASLRNSSGATTQKEIYNGLRGGPPYEDLPIWTKQADLSTYLQQWEGNHPDCCSPQRDGGVFFGIGTSAKFDLGTLVQVVFIPAVRDAAADATDMRGSPITELLDIAFRSGMSEREDFRTLQADVEARYGEIIDDAKQVQFRQVEERLSRTMETFVSNVGVRLDWLESEKLKLPSPSADVLIVEDGYESPVSRTGHGIQRAFTLSLLQEIAAARSGIHRSAPQGSIPSPGPVPMLLLIIEEPEVFQYPNRRRSIARTLQELASGSVPGVAEKTQVIFGTHDPLFVAISRVEQVRVLRKLHIQSGAPKATTVRRLDPQAFLDDLSRCKDPNEPVGEWSFHQMKLISIMTSTVNEGLFAKAVVLVEGDIDRAGILAACSLETFNLEDIGISVIQCRGKANLVRLSLIFRQLGIEAFVVWDGDAHKKGQPAQVSQRQRENRELYRMVGVPPVDPPVTQISEGFACIETDLEKQVHCELGDFLPTFMQQARDRYGMNESDAIKHSVVFEEMLRAAKQEGISSPTLDAIVDKLKGLVSRL